MSRPLNDRLRDNLKHHRDCTLRLQATLLDEQQALTANDADALLKATAAKAAAAERLRALATHLDDLCRESGAESVRQMVKQQGDGAAHSYWQDLLTLAEDCNTANRRNAALLDARQSQVRAALNILFPAQSPQTYGRAGFSAAPPNSRLLGQA